MIYKHDIDTPTHITKYDAVRTVLYTSSGGGGGRGTSGIGPIYSVRPFVQREHGIGSFLQTLWRTVRPVLWSNAKSPGREALRTGGKIMADIADNPSQTDARDILSKHVSESTLYIIKKLRGSGSGARKRKRSSSPKTRKQKNKRARITKRKASSKTIKRDIPVIRISHYPIMSGDVVFVTSEFDIFEQKPIQTAILETHVVHHKPIATVDQNDLGF